MIVTCGFSGQSLQDENWPGRANGTHLLAAKVLPNGEKFWLLWEEYPTGEVERAMLAEASRLMKDTPTDVQRSRSVYVIRVGDHYLVEDPSDDTKGGEFQLAITLDSSFAVLARIAT